MTEAVAHNLYNSKRFEILSRLGAGGAGEVFLANDRERGARVAIKTLRTPTAEMIRSLKREFRSVQDIQHPNLVRLGELFEESGLWFFTMEFIGVEFLSTCRPAGAALVRQARRSPRRMWHFDKRAALGLAARAGLSALHGNRFTTT
jgi:serine/threonine protein kinase